MGVIKDGAKFNVSENKDYVKLAKRIKETASDTGTYSSNSILSEQEQQAMQKNPSTGNEFEQFIFHNKYALNIQNVDPSKGEVT